MRDSSQAVTFRLKKSILYQGIGFSLFYLMVVGLYVMLGLLLAPGAENEGSPNISVMVMGGIVFGPMLLLSLYLWRAYYVERLTFDGQLISLRSMTQNHHFDRTEIQSLAWSPYPRGGSLRIRIPGASVRLSLGGYSHDDRQQIITRFREIVPHSQQENWPTFCHRIAIRLRDGYFPNADAPAAEQIQRELQRRDLIRKLVLFVTITGMLLTPLLLKLGVDKLTAVVIGMSVLLIGVFGFLPFLPRGKTKWTTEDEALAVRLWEEDAPSETGGQ